jgi:hypothetical protein
MRPAGFLFARICPGPEAAEAYGEVMHARVRGFDLPVFYDINSFATDIAAEYVRFMKEVGV